MYCVLWKVWHSNELTKNSWISGKTPLLTVALDLRGTTCFTGKRLSWDRYVHHESHSLPQIVEPRRWTCGASARVSNSLVCSQTVRFRVVYSSSMFTSLQTTHSSPLRCESAETVFEWLEFSEIYSKTQRSL